MQHILSTLTPQQLTLLAGVFISLVHTTLIKSVLLRAKQFSDSHRKTINVVTSLVLPGIIGGLVALHNSGSFNHLFPQYGELYLVAQTWYYTAGKVAKTIKKWYEAYVTLNAQVVAPEQSF